MNVNEEVINEYNDEQLKLEELYKLIQYDTLFGEQELINEGFY